MVAFAIPVVVAVIVGCIVRIKNMRMKALVFSAKSFFVFVFLGKLHRLNTFLTDVRNNGTGRGSVLDDWINRRKGFKRLGQYSDEENEPLDSNVGDDSDDETITITGKQQTTMLNNKSNTTTFKMGANL